MKRNLKLILIIGLIIIPLLNLSSQQNSNSNSSANVCEVTDINQESTIKNFEIGIEMTILHAYYYDLDSDGNEDDILSVIQFSTCSNRVEFVITDLYQYLTLPSGFTYSCGFRIIGYFETVVIEFYWYNVATESGWYTLEAYSESWNNYWVCYNYDTVTFDPPESDDGGMPRVEAAVAD
ncbi:MAG: hypothetical protein EAX90_15880 [Candidatus Heimdallarchaeota archaeon]|nr:hypothetical protein [Candidatus Heimdallarchaeota archaeon]